MKTLCHDSCLRSTFQFLHTLQLITQYAPLQAFLAFLSQAHSCNGFLSSRSFPFFLIIFHLKKTTLRLIPLTLNEYMFHFNLKQRIHPSALNVGPHIKPHFVLSTCAKVNPARCSLHTVKGNVSVAPLSDMCICSHFTKHLKPEYLMAYVGRAWKSVQLQSNMSQLLG